MIRDALRLHEATGDNADYKRGYKAGEFLSKSVSIEYIAAEKDIAQRKQLIKGLAKDETIMAFARMRHLHNESERFLQGYKDGFRAAFLKRLQRTSLHKMDPLEEALAPNDDERDILDFLERELKDAAQGHDTRVGHGLNRAGFRSNTTGPTQGRQRVS